MSKQYLCSELVRVRLMDGGRRRWTVGILEQISSQSAKLQLEEKPAIGSRVRVGAAGREKPWRFDGRVVAVQYEAALGYYVDVLFETGVRWRECDYKPEHLLAIA